MISVSPYRYRARRPIMVVMAKATTENTRRECKHCGHVFYVRKPSMAGRYCSRPCRYARQPAEPRFSERTDKSGGPEACWPWTGTRTTAGYGWLIVDGVQTYAHRLAIILRGEVIPGGHEVMHVCDNPWCVNPIHLLVGTRADNARDMVVKGRSQRGAGHWNAKMTNREIQEIRDLRAYGFSNLWLERTYDCTNISRIVNRKAWRHI